MWEEPCISGEHGSGLFRVYIKVHILQNAEIAAAHVGKKITVERLSDFFWNFRTNVPTISIS